MIILASTSPRRRELLTACNVPFEIVPSGCDESILPNELPEQMVARLALAKAKSVAGKTPDKLVLGADTTVFIGNEILGKPEDARDAARMLGAIQGNWHEVWGGIALYREHDGFTQVRTDVTKVLMCPMHSETISRYVATGEPMDKAGSYAIQGIGLQFVDRIEGSYSNVVGLNVAIVMQLLREAGVSV